MLELPFFNLSYRCGNIVRHLQRNDGPSESDYVQDAIGIITDCTCVESTESIVRQYSSKKLYTPEVLVPIVFEVFKNESIESIVKSLNGYVGVLRDFEETHSLPKERQKELQAFFSKVSKISQKYSNRVVRTRSLEKHFDALPFSA